VITTIAAVRARPMSAEPKRYLERSGPIIASVMNQNAIAASPPETMTPL
jgi:hypothetical protein